MPSTSSIPPEQQSALPSAASPASSLDRSPLVIGPLQLFLVFSQISLSGFGGVLPFVYRAMVEKHKWLTAAELAELLAMGQILPGPVVCNVSVMIGYRYAGMRGGLAALAGMIVVPTLIIIGIGFLYGYFENVTQVQNAVRGMGAAAAGLLAATAIKMALSLPRRWTSWLFAGLQFSGIAVMHWPLLAVILCLAPIAIATIAFDQNQQRLRAQDGEENDER